MIQSCHPQRGEKAVLLGDEISAAALTGALNDIKLLSRRIYELDLELEQSNRIISELALTNRILKTALDIVS